MLCLAQPQSTRFTQTLMWSYSITCHPQSFLPHGKIWVHYYAVFFSSLPLYTWRYSLNLSQWNGMLSEPPVPGIEPGPPYTRDSDWNHSATQTHVRCSNIQCLYSNWNTTVTQFYVIDDVNSGCYTSRNKTRVQYKDYADHMIAVISRHQWERHSVNIGNNELHLKCLVTFEETIQ